MAKTGFWKTGRSRYRLLICSFILLLSANFGAVAGVSKEVAAGLLIKADSDYFFTGMENSCTLEIPGLSPSEIGQTELPIFPAGTQLISLKKEEFLQDGSSKTGTRFHFWFSFTGSGEFAPDPFTVKIGWKTYKIPFEKVTVFENPSTIMPQMKIEFPGKDAEQKNGVKVFHADVGEKIRLNVNLCYFVQIMNFKWTIPADSIFKQTGRFSALDLTSPRSSEFSPEAVPVATFLWQPLVKGEYSSPAFELTATAYNGSRIKVPLPLFKVIVSERKLVATLSQEKSGESLLNSAFTEIQETLPSQNEKAELSLDDCKKLVQLRADERHALPFSSARQLRRQKEAYFGIESSANEAQIFPCFLFALLAFIFLLVALIFLFFKKYRRAVTSFFLTLAAFAGFLVFFYKASADFALCYGGKISPVPEEESSVFRNLASGERVKILERAGNWVYVSAAGEHGWVLSENIFEIK